MRDVIQKVIATEAEAKRLVLVARADAGRILAEAETRAELMAADVRQEVQLVVQQILTSAVTDAEKEKQTRLAVITAEIEQQIDLSEIERRQAIEAVVRWVGG